MTDPITVNATIGLSEMVKAAAHQRIAFLESEKLRLNELAREAQSKKENLEETIAYALIECGPDEISTLNSAAFGAMDANECGAWWEASDPESDTYQIIIRGPAKQHASKERTGITGELSFKYRAWLPTDEIKAQMAEAVAANIAQIEAERAASNIEDMLRDRAFRERLEGELLSRYIEDTAPDIGAKLAALATDTTTRRLIGVGG